jgi:transposase
MERSVSISSQMVERLREVGPALVVMEATGGFEFPTAVVLTAAGTPVAIANPRQVCDLGRSTGQLNRPRKRLGFRTPAECFLQSVAV